MTDRYEHDVQHKRSKWLMVMFPTLHRRCSILRQDNHPIPHNSHTLKQTLLPKPITSKAPNPLQRPPRRPHNFQPHRIPTIRQPISARMPRHTQRRRTRLHPTDILPRLHMRDLKSITLIAPTHHIRSIPAKPHASHAAYHCAQRAPAYPVGGVPERYQRVGAAGC